MPIFITAFAIGFFASLMLLLFLPSLFQSGKGLDSIELPILRISGFSLSQRYDQVIVGQRLLNRVQIYDKNGHFVEGFFLRNRESKYQVAKLDDGGFIDCRTTALGDADLYDASGRFVAEVQNPLSDIACETAFPAGTGSMSPRQRDRAVLAPANGLVFGRIISNSSSRPTYISSSFPVNLLALLLHPVLAGLTLATIMGAASLLQFAARNRLRGSD